MKHDLQAMGRHNCNKVSEHVRRVRFGLFGEIG